MTTQILIAPGYQGSGEQHWQTYWQRENQEYIRIEQRDWSHPDADEWTETMEQYIRKTSGNAVVVAHSLGCLALALWAQKTKQAIKGALLVAPPNPADEKLKTVVKGFSPFQPIKLPFKSLVVASTDDPYMPIEQAEALARRWGSSFVNIGAKGHINAQSNLGNWAEGRKFISAVL